MSQQQSRADFCCPACDSSDLFLVSGTDGTYQCQHCDAKTHEKIEAIRDDLEDLADSDNPASRIAGLLAGDSE